MDRSNEFLSSSFQIGGVSGGPRPSAAASPLAMLDDIELEDEDDSPPVSEMLRLMLLGYDLQEMAQRLESLHDGLPLPRVFSWGDVRHVEDLLELSPEDKRTVLVFEQILQQSRKSGKHYAAMQALAAKYPDSPELEMLLLSYLNLWDPAEAEARFRTLLEGRPDWLLLRSLLGAKMLLAAEESFDAQVEADFRTLMQDRFELHEHADPAGLRADQVFPFYQTMAWWYILTGHPERALYCLNVCARTGLKGDLDELLMVLLERAEADGKGDRLREFIEPLQRERIKQLRTARAGL